MMFTISCHNEFEAKTLLKEYDECGEFVGDNIKFITHRGEVIGIAEWNEIEQKHDEIE